MSRIWRHLAFGLVLVAFAGCSTPGVPAILPSPDLPQPSPEVPATGFTPSLWLAPFEPAVALVAPHGSRDPLDSGWEARAVGGGQFVLAMRGESQPITVAAEGVAAEGRMTASVQDLVAFLAGPETVVLTFDNASLTPQKEVIPVSKTALLSEGMRFEVGARDLVATIERRGAGAFTLLAPDGTERARFGVGLVERVPLDQRGSWRLGCADTCAGSVELMLRGYDRRIG